MIRFLVAVALVLASVLPARGQGTPMPIPLAQWFANDGTVLTSGGLCVFAAGTSTLINTYTTSALSVANSNPILFTAGRPSSGGVFLTPGSSYKFILKDFTGVVSPTCVPDTGVTIWSVDNVSAVPASAAAVDVTATAGETIGAGDAVFISTGAGGLSAGQIYKTDADFTYRSTSAVMVGIAPNQIVSGSTGTVRISGAVTLPGPLTPGAPYYAGAVAATYVVTPPTNAIRLGIAQSATSMIVGYTAAPVSPRGPPCGRLTLTTNVPVTTADVTGASATTVYYTPFGGCNQIGLFDGTAWSDSAFDQISIAVPATTNTLYDVFAYDNSGVVALELTAWTNDTTRATALTRQNGVYVKTGALTRRYLGTFRTTGVSGQSEDSVAKRYLWNYYNRVQRSLYVFDTTNTWAYTLAVFRQANANAANQVDVVVGVSEDAIDVLITAASFNTTAAVDRAVAVGEDSTSTPATQGAFAYTSVQTDTAAMTATLRKIPAEGRHFYVWLEYSTALGATTWIGDAGVTYARCGIVASWKA